MLPTDRGVSLDDMIAQVLAAREKDLGMTAAEASAAVGAIIEADRTDEAALRAHDLLWMRATFGRAW